MGGNSKRIEGNIRLYGAGGTDPDDVEGAFFITDLPGPEVYIGQGIQLMHHDVDVVGPDAGRQSRDPFIQIGPGAADEFPVPDLAFDVMEIARDLADPPGIASHDDRIGQLLRLKAEMVDTSVGVDEQFGFREHERD